MERIFEPQSVEYQASNSMPLSDAEDNGFRLFGRTIQMSQSSAQTLTPQEIFVQKGTQAVEPLQSAKPTAQLPPSTPPLPLPPPQQQAAALPCPRCASRDTKFCYYNNYNVNQPRHFCRACHRYWTAGGSLRNVPVGSGRRGRGKQSAAQSAGLPPAAAVATAAVTTGSDEPVRRRMKPHNQQNQLESVEQPVDDSENHQPTERPQEQPSQRRMRLTKQRTIALRWRLRAL
ncbi:hypothetical protein CLOM_g21452 [Closterium sp. NIES-68]|nr:hypothetical protein CLOM_g21452 [Closterium sp. NIES-68]